MIARYSSILAVAAVFSAAFGLTPARAALLTYDTPIINLNSGDSVTIGATLFAPGLQTDKFGEIITPSCGFCTQTLYVAEQKKPDFLDPRLLPRHYTKLTVGSPNPVGNLDGSNSTHLILGELKTNPSLPGGTYFLDIGIYQKYVVSLPPGVICFCAVSGFVDSSPDFADAGFITVNVSGPAAAPEPATLAFFAMGLAGFGVMRRRAIL